MEDEILGVIRSGPSAQMCRTAAEKCRGTALGECLNLAASVLEDGSRWLTEVEYLRAELNMLRHGGTARARIGVERAKGRTFHSREAVLFQEVCDLLESGGELEVAFRAADSSKY